MDYNEFKLLPPTEIIAVHGEWCLLPGYYKSGSKHTMLEGDVLLCMTKFSYNYYLRINGFWVYHKEDGPAICYKDGFSKYYTFGKPDDESP